MIAILTEEQKDILIGNKYDGVCYFNPIQDFYDNWIISEIEYYYCLGLWYLDELQTDLQFITTLSLSEYLPKPQTPLI
tara:strand:- start:34 stop:267 length:234 start_codon:yes stop_codon:yes gene_type:complete